MRRLVYILLMLVVAGAFSCRRGERAVEERLVAIDSLIATAPDSALALLDGIRGDSLPQPLQAYRDLLVSQAMYKAYIPASSDTLIARAWSYYRNHGPYDRRIRTLLYSGTVAKELGHSDSAMLWFKRCENEVNNDDYFNRAFVHLRMAYLYQFQYVSPEKAIALHKESYDDFKRCDNLKYQLACLTELGMIYRLVNKDSAFCHANKAIQLAKQLNDTNQLYKNYESLAGYYIECENWEMAKDYSLRVVNSAIPNSACFYLTSQSFLQLGILDSAWLFFNHAPEPMSTRDSVLYYRTLSDLFYKNGDYKKSAENAEKAGDISGNAIITQSKINYRSIEKEFENSILAHSNEQLILNLKLFWSLVTITFVGFSIALFFIMALYRDYKNEQQIIKDNIKNANAEIKLLKEKLVSQQQEIEHNDSTSERFKEIITKQSSCLTLLFNSTIYSGLKGASIFKYILDAEKATKKTMVRIKLPESFWINLNDYVSLSFPNAFNSIEHDGIVLTSKEKKLIMLDCLQVPNAVIAIVLGYADFSTASLRNRLITKLHGNGMNIYQIMQSKSRQ